MDRANQISGGLLNSAMAPTSVSTRFERTAPKIGYENGMFRVSNCELISSSIAGSTGFTVQSTFALQPGLAATFPWLAPQAQKYQFYSCTFLEFIYIPIAPTSTQGDIMIVPDYDASDPAPTTEVQASDNKNCVVDSCWKVIRCRLDPRSLMGLGPRKFIRPCAVAGDPKTFDMGKVFVISNNETGTTAVGKLFVDYEFVFMSPQNSPDPSTIPQQTSLFTRAANQTLTTAVGAAVNWDTLVFDPLGIGAGVSGVFTPPAGTYRVEAVVSCNDNTAEVFDAQLELFKNGASLTKVIKALAQGGSAAASSQLAVPLIGVIPMNGSDTFQVQVTLTGAGGTLIVVANEATLVVSLA